MESSTKGTMILLSGERFYKILKLRSTGDNNYLFECKDLDTKESKVLQYRMSGLREALDQAIKRAKQLGSFDYLSLVFMRPSKSINTIISLTSR